MSERQHEERVGAEPNGGDDRLAELELDEVDVRDLLRKALEPPADEPPKDILTGVQRRIRARSAGRFFADGWSTSVAPRATFLVTALLMLLVAIITWVLIGPTDLHLQR